MKYEKSTNIISLDDNKCWLGILIGHIQYVYVFVLDYSVMVFHSREQC